MERTIARRIDDAENRLAGGLPDRVQLAVAHLHQTIAARKGIRRKGPAHARERARCDVLGRPRFGQPVHVQMPRQRPAYARLLELFGHLRIDERDSLHHARPLRIAAEGLVIEYDDRSARVLSQVGFEPGANASI